MTDHVPYLCGLEIHRNHEDVLYHLEKMRHQSKFEKFASFALLVNDITFRRNNEVGGCLHLIYALEA